MCLSHQIWVINEGRVDRAESVTDGGEIHHDATSASHPSPPSALRPHAALQN